MTRNRLKNNKKIMRKKMNKCKIMINKVKSIKKVVILKLVSQSTSRAVWMMISSK